MIMEMYIDGDTPLIIEKKHRILKKVLEALDNNPRYLTDNNLALLTSGDGVCCNLIGLLPDDGWDVARLPPRFDFRSRPSPDFFEKITFKGKKGTLSNPHVYTLGADGTILSLESWNGKSTISVDEFVADLKRAPHLTITKVQHNLGFSRPPYDEELAAQYNHRRFIEKQGHWFKNFIHVGWGEEHYLYCFNTEDRLDKWWDKIKDELLIFNPLSLRKLTPCI